MKMLRLNPAAILFAVNAVVNMAVAWGIHLSAGQAGAIGAVTTAVITIITAAMTRPVGLQLITGAVTSLATAFAAFGLHLSSSQVSTEVIVLSIVLGGILHLAHVPVSVWKQGTTATELEARSVRRPGSAL